MKRILSSIRIYRDTQHTTQNRGITADHSAISAVCSLSQNSLLHLHIFNNII